MFQIQPNNTITTDAALIKRPYEVMNCFQITINNPQSVNICGSNLSLA